MNIQFYFKNTDADNGLKDYTKKKLINVFRFYNKVNEIYVEFEADAHHSHGDGVKKVFLTVYVPREVIRLEESGKDFREAMGLLIPKLKLQIKKYKEKQQTAAKKNGRTFKQAIRAVAGKIMPQIEKEGFIPQYEIVKRKEFALAEPISENKAIEEMSRLGHDFFVFNDSQNGKNGIVYKRRDGRYGKIQLE